LRHLAHSILVSVRHGTRKESALHLTSAAAAASLIRQRAVVKPSGHLQHHANNAGMRWWKQVK
jgi:hypothetical protein